MKFYTQTHKHYCGIDLHARNLYVCILDEAGETRVHKNIKARPDDLMKLITPYLEDLVIGVECACSPGFGSPTCAARRRSLWSWDTRSTGGRFMAARPRMIRSIRTSLPRTGSGDRGPDARRQVPGSLCRSARNARHPQFDAPTHASDAQAVRASGLPIHNTNNQYNLPEIQKNLRVAFNREGIAERFADSSVSKSIELDLNLSDFYDQQLGKVEWSIQKQAKACDLHSLI